MRCAPARARSSLSGNAERSPPAGPHPPPQSIGLANTNHDERPARPVGSRLLAMHTVHVVAVTHLVASCYVPHRPSEGRSSSLGESATNVGIG